MSNISRIFQIEIFDVVTNRNIARLEVIVDIFFEIENMVSEKGKVLKEVVGYMFRKGSHGIPR